MKEAYEGRKDSEKEIISNQRLIDPLRYCRHLISHVRTLWGQLEIVRAEVGIGESMMQT